MAKKTDPLESGAGIFADFVTKLMAAVRRRGGTGELVHRLVQKEGEETLEKFAALIVGSAASTLYRDMRKEGCELLEHVPRTINSIADLELVSLLEKGKYYIKGEEEILRRARTVDANLGQEDAEWLLVNQHLIPKDWRGDLLLTFPRTVWRFPSGDLGVPCLSLVSDRWCLGFRWLRIVWSSYDRLVRKSMSADRQA